MMNIKTVEDRKKADADKFRKQIIEPIGLFLLKRDS